MWKRYFKTVSTAPSGPTNNSFLAMQSTNDRGSAGTSSKFSSYLPEVYAGHPNRIQRYYQYDDMDRDSDINAALDTIADFCTQSEEQNDQPFEIYYNGEPNETEVSLLKTALVKWTKINSFRSRLWHMFRSTIKNGDAFFLRDPETGEWLWIDTFMVELVKVDETAGKEPSEYIIRGLDYNKQAKFATISADPSQYRSPLGSSNAGGAKPASAQSAAGFFSLAGADSNPQQRNLLTGAQNHLSVVEAINVIHLSLSVGMDINWPFGASILEPVFKTYKQKELLEDAVIIYRVQRAPERRIFYIDTGSMPPDRAKAHIERIKNEIHQRRIPNRCLSLDTKIYLLDGRLLPLRDVITEYNEGKQNWVYSCNPETGAIVPGKITWAGETRKQTKVVKLTLDNDETIITTPDHSFPIPGKGFVKAQDLTIGESFFPLYLREMRYHKNKNPYTQVFDSETKQWKYTHKLVTDYFGEEITETNYKDCYTNLPKDTIHHIDYDRYNNNPENLTRMAFKDHLALHGDNGEVSSNAWRILKENNPARFKQRIDSLQEQNQIFWKDVERRREAFAEFHINYNADLFILADSIICASKTNPKYSLKTAAIELSNNKEFMTQLVGSNQRVKDKSKLKNFSWQQLGFLIENNGFSNWNSYIDHLESTGRISRDYSLYRFSAQIWNLFTQVYHTSRETTFKKLLQLLKLNIDFMNEFERLHKNMELVVCDRYLDRLVKINGYKNYRDFRKSNFNPNYATKDRSFTSKYNFDTEMFAIFKRHYKELSKNTKRVFYHKLYQSVQKDVDFCNRFFDINKKHRKRRIGPTTIMEMLKKNGFVDFNDFCNKFPYLNHKLVSIEILDDLHDTGTITVDGEEKYHAYHTFAIQGGIFTKNSGGGSSVLDAAYSPLGMLEDYYFAQSSDGRGSKVETLPGGEMTGEIGDLLFFAKKLARGLRIPASYLALGGDQEAPATYNDGKLGAALIQEFRFNKYCMRIQSLLAPMFDKDFKWFLRKNGIEIDENLFELRFLEPQNFTKYRQIELDAQQVQVYTQLVENKRLSERFKLKRFLNLTDEELIENEKLWSEENAAKLKKQTGSTPAESPSQDLGSVGIRSGGLDMGMEPDMGGGEEPPPDATGAGGATPTGPGAAPPAGGGEAPPA